MSRYFKIEISKPAKKSLEKIPHPWKLRIKDAVDALKGTPYVGEKMWGKLSGKRKIRVWPYRIVYTICKKEKTIKVLRIAHRQGAYK
ncbi:MAG: type II toxin-antitoxin system RelE/ParE family toxin [Thermodesulfobacterium sp.]|nr:type II toxin-antitoxin system RelE/ParE family toxin [Thermodesulfobacterium sp.]